MNGPDWGKHVQRFGLIITITLFASASAAWAAPGDSPTGESGAESAPAPDSAETSSSDASRLLERLPGDVIYLKNSSGRLVPVPRNATLEEFLQWQQRRRQAPQGDQPQYSVTSLALKGKADERHARLTATIRVRIFPEESWVPVPLALNEAVLLETAHEGDGSVLFDHRQFGPGSGHRWLFKGQGLHELTLSMIVPVRKRVASRQLQLSLPPTAVSSLTLRVPLQRISVKTSPQADQPTVTTRSLNASGTEIEAHGLTQRFSLQWQPVPEERSVEPVLESNTFVKVTVPGESVVLEAQQQVAALQGRFEQVSVRLPDGFELLDATPAVSHRDEEDPERVVVRLPEPTSGPVDLVWRLKSDRPGREAPLVVEGFEVERARRQTGRIAVQTVDGVQFVRRSNACRSVHRINTSELPDVSDVATAYQFFSQPFRLALDMREIEAYATAEPRFVLLFSAGTIELDAVFRFQLYRGTVEQVELRWPNFRSEGWELRPLQSPGLVENVTVTRKDGDAVLRVQLVQRQDGAFELPLRATRSVSSGSQAAESVPLTLPETVDAHSLPGLLVAAQAENVESLLSPEDGTAVQPLPAENLDAVALPDDVRNLDRSGFRIEPTARNFSARITVHDREIETATALALQVRDDRVQVEQTLSYEIAYERLSQLRLIVPGRLENRVRFTTEAGTQLSGNRTGLKDGSAEQVRLMLPEPRLGRVAVKARFAVPLPRSAQDEGEIPLVLPVIRSADAEFSSVRLTVPAEDRLQLAVEDPNWKREVSLENDLVWTARGRPSEIPLTLRTATRRSAQHYSVRKALIRTRTDRSGLARSRAQFRVANAPATLTLNFPPRLAADRFWWDRTELRGDHIERIDRTPLQYRLTLPDDARDGEHLLTVDYHTETASEYGWSRRHEFLAPRFPEDVWVEQTVWQLRLPADQHLFTDPDGFTRQFHWERETVLWTRRPDPEYRDLAGWIAAEQGPPEPAGFSQGTAYPFSRFGPAESISYRSMSRSLVVLIGAGLALTLGFLFLQIRATRNVLTLFMLAFGLALAGLWYTGPVQVLLQPALLGLLLALAATMVDGFLRRERTPPVLALPSASDYRRPSQPSSAAGASGTGEASRKPSAPRPSSWVSESTGKP